MTNEQSIFRIFPDTVSFLSNFAKDYISRCTFVLSEIMSKMPVSVLQEYAVRRMWGIPVYTLMSSITTTVPPRFTYKVTCHSTSASGTASNKKEAKHVAARELLKLLPPNQEIVSLSTCNPKVELVDSYYLPGSCLASDEDIFVNSVGKLSELCAVRKLKLPEYQDCGMVGPPHAPKFTMICSIGNLQVEASSKTKKQAKHEAAKEMLKKLVKDPNYCLNNYSMMNSDLRNIEEIIRNINLIDLKIEEPSMSMKESSERAKKLFPKLKNYKGVNNPMNNIRFDDYHRFFKNSYEPFVRETVRARLSESSRLTMTKQEMLEDIANLLGLSVEYNVLTNGDTHPRDTIDRRMEISSTDNNRIIVIISLNSTPIISDSGIGETYLDARDEAIINLLDSIDIFLT